jgi:multidrug resistance efflux pump
MKRLSKTTGLSIAFLTLLGGLFVRNVAAGPANDVRPGDIKKATRVASADGGVDAREPLAEAGYVVGNGVVEPADRETKIGAAVPGRIARIPVKEGDFVAAGSDLVELDDAPEKAALDAAEADLDVARATLTRTTKGLRKEDVDALVQDAQAARARAISSDELAARTDQLAATGAVTAEERDRVRHQAEADDGAFKAADSRRLAGVNGGRVEDIRVAQAQVDGAVARRDEARATLAELNIHAPIDGTVLQLKSRVGEYYNTLGTEPILVLGDTRTLKVRMDVDERDVARIKLNANGYVTLDAYPGRRFEGKVIEIGRRMGRKNVRSDDPVERIDTKILEVVLQLADSSTLVPGIRVTSYVSAS